MRDDRAVRGVRVQPEQPDRHGGDRETVERLLAVAVGIGALFVVDEAYGEFAPWSDAGVWSATDRAAGRRADVLEVWSFAAVQLRGTAMVGGDVRVAGVWRPDPYAYDDVRYETIHEYDPLD